MAKNLKDKKVIIYEQVNAAKPGGAPVMKYKPIHPGRLWAYVRQLSTKELEPASGEWTQDTMRFVINWRSDVITLDHYVEYRGIFYEIMRVDTYEGYKDEIRITGDQLGSQPQPSDTLPYG